MIYLYSSSPAISSALLCFRQPWIRSLDLNLLENSRWVPRNNNEIRHIFSDHTSRPDGDPPPDSDASKHRHITAEPAVFPNSNRRPQLRPLSTIAQKRI